jgi:hypothetical protein
MRFRLFSFVLLAALFLQSAVAFGSTTTAQRSGDIEHLIVHSQDADHHHHADSSLHMDADGSAPHSHPDYGSSSAALVNADNPACMDSRASFLGETLTTLWISATVDGLLRPPTLRA